MHSEPLIILVVATALAFDFTNGFHDTANVVATSISTRALSPRVAVALAAILNFAGAFISLKVAATVATGIIDSGAITLPIVFAGLIGASVWNLATWYFGLPSSSSHALIGGVVGSMIAAKGTGAVQFDGLLGKVVIPAFISPILAFAVAATAIVLTYRMTARLRPAPPVAASATARCSRAAMLALAHGTNDAQKTMGVITLALVANGDISAAHFAVPDWVVIAAASAIALGTYAGGWRIIRTLGSRIIKMDPAQGFTAQSAGAAVVLAASHVGFPLSTTHVMAGGIIGAGSGKRLSAVRWGIAGNMAIAWLVTLPAAAAVGAATYGVSVAIGNGTLGPFVIAAVAAAAILATMTRRARELQAKPADAKP